MLGFFIIMQYFWLNNKVAEVWFRNKRKPPEHNNKLIQETYVPSGIQFGSHICVDMFNHETPTTEKFTVLRLTKCCGGYAATGAMYVNAPSLAAELKNYDFDQRKYVTKLGLVPVIPHIAFYTYSRCYEVKLWGNDAPELDLHNKSRLSEDNKEIYTEILRQLPSIAKELFAIIPEVKRKK